MKKETIYFVLTVIMLVLFSGITIWHGITGNIDAALGWFNAALWAWVNFSTMRDYYSCHRNNAKLTGMTISVLNGIKDLLQDFTNELSQLDANVTELEKLIKSNHGTDRNQAKD